MANGGTPLLDSFIVLILKVAPLIFSIVLRVTEKGFYPRWRDMWNQYRGAKSLSGEWMRNDWRYHNVSLYSYDKFNVESSLELSLVYVTILHLLLVAQEGAILLLGPSVVFFLLALSVGRVVEAFFAIDPEGRNPDRYEGYYYDENAGLGDKDIHSYKRWFLPLKLDRFLSPPRASILIEGLIIIDIAVLEAVMRIYSEEILNAGLPVSTDLFAILISLVIW